MNERSIPAFVRGTRLQHDKARDQWVVMAPEKAFMPDAIAVQVLRLVDGRLTLGGIIDLLAARYEAPRAVIASDVLEMVNELAAKRVLQDQGAGA